MGQVAIGARLAAYGLREADAQLDDLQVAGKQDFDVSAKNPAVAKRIHTLHPSSLDDLKRWIGTPANLNTVSHIGPLGGHAVVPRNKLVDIHAAVDLRAKLPSQLTRAHTTALYAAAHQFVLANDHGLDAATISNVNKWLVAIKPQISIILFRDIHVAAGAKLTVNTAHSVLFARYIEIEKTGQIKIKAALAKIDCAGIKGH